MSSIPNPDVRNCVECNREFFRKPNEGVQRFQGRTFCSQTCCRALRKRTMRRIAHPEDVAKRLGELQY